MPEPRDETNWLDQKIPRDSRLKAALIDIRDLTPHAAPSKTCAACLAGMALDVEERLVPGPASGAATCEHCVGSCGIEEYEEQMAAPGPASVSPAEPPDARRTRRSLSDRELTQLQETGSVVVGHSMVDGVRLSAITAALLLLGIDPDAVVLHGTGADHIAVTVKPDA